MIHPTYFATYLSGYMVIGRLFGGTRCRALVPSRCRPRVLSRRRGYHGVSEVGLLDGYAVVICDGFMLVAMVSCWLRGFMLVARLSARSRIRKSKVRGSCDIKPVNGFSEIQVLFGLVSYALPFLLSPFVVPKCAR